jgi:hypothetical protein
VKLASSWRLARFRKNEVLRDFAEGLPGPFAFRCECADRGCRELVLVEADDVYAVRANPRRLVMAIGHHTDQEQVVIKYDGYSIVELMGQGGSSVT